MFYNSSSIRFTGYFSKIKMMKIILNYAFFMQINFISRHI